MARPWTPANPAELQPGTKFRLVGKTKEYRVSGPVTRSSDGVYLVPTNLGVGRLKPDTAIEYQSDFM